MISYTTNHPAPGASVIRQSLNKEWIFPSGEVGVRVNDSGAPQLVGKVTIMAALQSSDDVMKLLMTTDALRRQYYNAHIELVLGYTPYGRQDRVCSSGESLSIKVFADLINSQHYDRVTIIDPHSHVTEALIDRSTVFSQEAVFIKCFSPHIPLEERDLIVAPDAGAAKKAASIVHHGFKDILYANKTRDMETGHIKEYTLTGDVEHRNVLVVDDLVDGGATFLLLGKKLKEAGAAKIVLCVTHGIFTQGEGRLAQMYDEVYTTNSYHSDRIGKSVLGVNYQRIL